MVDPGTKIEMLLRRFEFVSLSLSFLDLLRLHPVFYLKTHLDRGDLALVTADRQPFVGADQILLHAETIIVHEPEIALRLSVPVLGRVLIKIERFFHVLLHAKAFLIHQSESVPRPRAAVAGSFLQPLARLL